MKIAVFVSYLPPHVGGLEVVAENQVKELSKAGQQVSVTTSACDAQAGTVEADGYKVRRIPAWNYFERKMGAVFPIFAPSLLWHAYKTVKKSDVIHAHDAFYLTSLAAAFWARIFGKPLILTQHVDMVPHPKKIVQLVQNIVYATTGSFIMHSSTKIIVLNSRVEAFLASKGIAGTKIKLLPNSVDTESFTPATVSQKLKLREKYGLPKNKVLALFVGRFVPKKGFSKLLGMSEIHGLDIVFAGGNAPAGHRRSDHHFLGTIERRIAPEIFKMCDIFVLPSQGEGFPVTIQEAMASGLAIVTTDDPAYASYKLDRKRTALIEPTPDTIAAALTELKIDKEKLTKAKQYARNYACLNFDRELHTQKLLNLYSEVAV